MRYELRMKGSDKLRPKTPVRHNRLAEIRKSRYLEIKEVSIITGIDSSLICNHEKMKRHISEEHIKAYAKLYKVQTHELFFETEKEE